MQGLYQLNATITHFLEGFLETAVPMIAGLAEVVGHEMGSGLTTALEFLMSAIAKTFLLQNLESVVWKPSRCAPDEPAAAGRWAATARPMPRGWRKEINLPKLLRCRGRRCRKKGVLYSCHRKQRRLWKQNSASAFVFRGAAGPVRSGEVEGPQNRVLRAATFDRGTRGASAPPPGLALRRGKLWEGTIMFNSVNTCWTLVAAFLVYFMQAGFALCEAGFTRAKNTGNILMKNMMDFCIGTPCYWLIGFGIMFGGTGALIGGFDPFIQGDYSHLGLDIPLWVYIVFQTVFCATAATIVSGSMAERTNFKAYCVYSAMISLVVYPICGHWMWGGGWLQSMGFHDFAGSAAVHNVGGIIAMLGAALLGPRIGKYDKDGKPHAIPGHNLTAGALGVFILWFCWFGFNGGSSLSLSTDETMTLTGLVCFNTNLAAAVATCVTMIFTWKRYGKPDVSMTLNGSLAGLVAITAGCDAVSPFGAFIIGFVAGILVVLSVEFFDHIAKIDDPVGAVSVHFEFHPVQNIDADKLKPRFSCRREGCPGFPGAASSLP